MHSTLKFTSIAALTSTLLSGCVSNDSSPMQLQESRLSSTQTTVSSEAMALARDNTLTTQHGFQSLTPLAGQRARIRSQLDLSSRFSNTGELTFSADEMPGDELVHTVLGELLGVNYVIADGIANLAEPMSLNLQSAVSPRQLYVMVSELLASRSIAISLKDGVYFVHPKDGSQPSNSVLGYGRNPTDVPNVPGIVTQLVPVLYNQDISIERTIRELSGTQVSPADGQSAYYITGERASVLRAIELLDMLDNPSVRGRHIGLLRLNYISIDEFSKKIADVLATEGLPVDLNKPGSRNLVLIPIEHLGALAIFAADKLYVDRVTYWAQQLDQPSQGIDKQYFMFYPRFARAADLGQSVAALLGQNNQTGNQNRDTRSAQNSQQSSQQNVNASNVRTGTGQTQATTRGQGVTSAQSDTVRMTVDERANALIFYTTGKGYQDLLPMILRLDTMPKQIILEATIAEVTLTDEFAMGVEFALKNGRLNLGNVGALGVGGSTGIGGTGFSYSDAAGLDKILGQLSKKDGKVNVISNPSIVVRDGVTANISVGTDLPIVTATTTNPLDSDQIRQVNSQGYRKTGVELNVTPSISAQGLVVMEIDQSISNNAETDSSATNPAIFERKIKTEVIAQSGQTILLGGLISENKSNSETKVPFLGDLPILGNLFKSQKESTTKTELVLLITPKFIDNTNQWQQVRDRLNEGLLLLKLPVEKNDKEQ
jgi:general secretion pathway protein D